MCRRPPSVTLTIAHVPCTTLFRSRPHDRGAAGRDRGACAGRLLRAGKIFRSCSGGGAEPFGSRHRHKGGVRRMAGDRRGSLLAGKRRSEEHTSELQSIMRISYAVFCLKKKKLTTNH